jgi:hypothetical protein
MGLGIVFVDEAIDGGLQVDNRNEDTALQSPRGEFNANLTSPSYVWSVLATYRNSPNLACAVR